MKYITYKIKLVAKNNVVHVGKKKENVQTLMGYGWFGNRTSEKDLGVMVYHKFNMLSNVMLSEKKKHIKFWVALMEAFYARQKILALSHFTLEHCV